MKIPLRMDSTGTQSHKAVRLRIMQNDIIAAKRGDWNARRNLLREFRPLLQAMAEKRSGDPAVVSQFIERAESGVVRAVRKYKPAMGAEKFQVFALSHIEKAMDAPARPGLLARLFGRY